MSSEIQYKFLVCCKPEILSLTNFTRNWLPIRFSQYSVRLKVCNTNKLYLVLFLLNFVLNVKSRLHQLNFILKHDKWIQLTKQRPEVQNTNLVRKISELFGVCMELLSGITQSNIQPCLYLVLYITASEVYLNQDEVDDKVNIAFPSHKILKSH